MGLNVYVASSWRNQRQPEVVAAIREAGHEVYDFRNPKPGSIGFHWQVIDPDWESWSATAYIRALYHPVAAEGFGLDMEALERSHVVVLVQPCGISSHLELGWAAGAGRRTIVLLEEGEVKPELMYKMCSSICEYMEDVIDVLRVIDDDLKEVSDVEENSRKRGQHVNLRRKDFT